MSPRSMMSVAVFAAAIAVSPGLAHAEISRNVIAAFRGQLVITKGDLPEGKNDKETVSKIKAANLKVLEGEKGEEITSWHFSYGAFLSKTGATHLKMEFYRDAKTLSADKSLDGVDPKSGLLTGEISIDENEGLAAGKTYTVKLVTDKDAVVAQTTLTMK